MASEASRIDQLESGDLIAEALKSHAKRVILYDTYDRYYAGIHAMKFASSTFTQRFGATFQEFADNLCRKVVNTYKARTILESVSAKGQDKESEDAFRRARMDGLQRLVHKDAYLFGDAYVIAWEVDGNVRFYRNKPRVICPVYDEDSPGDLLCAVKVWATKPKDSKKKALRITVYYKDRCERYITESEVISDKPESMSIRPYEADGQAAIQTHKFERVPVFHFANMAGPGEFGTSAIADVIPLQDALNKACFDLFVNGEATSMAQRWVTGIDVEMGSDGKPKNPFEGKNLWVTGNEDANFGQLDAGDSEKLLAVVRDFRQEIGLVSGVPSYYLQTDASIPSGTALMVIEAPLRDAVEEAQVLFGNTWEDAFALSLGIEIDDCAAIWRDTSPIGMGERLENGIKKKVLGWSQRQNQRELGMTDDQIEDMAKERAEEDAAAVALAQRTMTRDPEA